MGPVPSLLDDAGLHERSELLAFGMLSRYSANEAATQHAKTSESRKLITCDGHICLISAGVKYNLVEFCISIDYLIK